MLRRLSREPLTLMLGIGVLSLLAVFVLQTDGPVILRQVRLGEHRHRTHHRMRGIGMKGQIAADERAIVFFCGGSHGIKQFIGPMLAEIGRQGGGHRRQGCDRAKRYEQVRGEQEWSDGDRGLRPSSEEGEAAARERERARACERTEREGQRKNEVSRLEASEEGDARPLQAGEEQHHHPDRVGDGERGADTPRPGGKAGGAQAE